MNYIDPTLCREIREKMDHLKISKNKGVFALLCGRRKKHVIQTNSQIHSWRIENPHEKRKKLFRKGINNIGSAFTWGVENYSGKIDEYFLYNLVGKIEDEIFHGIGHFRFPEEGVRITGSKYTPPYPVKVRSVEMPFFWKN